MRIPLKELVATGEPKKISSSCWYVHVARKDGVPVGPNTVVTFRTKREAVEFAEKKP